MFAGFFCLFVFFFFFELLSVVHKIYLGENGEKLHHGQYIIIIQPRCQIFNQHLPL